MTPKDVLTNRSFCPVPWTGIMYNFDGSVKNCIRSGNKIGNIQNTRIEEIVSGSTNCSTQWNMLNHIPAASCEPCYTLEKQKNSFDIVSDRIFYIKELKTVAPDTYSLPGKFDLQTVDIRWTNLCNFACVYCGPEYSSRWAQELGVEQSKPSLEQFENFKQYVLERAKNLKHVYLAGGEPLLMKENLELLEILYNWNPEVNIRVNTNLSKVDSLVFESICRFRNVHWTVSAETQGDEYEYIRYGGKWQDFENNLNSVIKLGHRITFNMLHFLLNYMSVFDFVDYYQAQGYHANSFVIGPLTKPAYLDIRNLPDTKLYQVKSELIKRINQNPGFLLEDSYRNMLKYIEQPYEKNLADSFDKLGKLDQRRSLNSSKIFKELYIKE